MVRGGTLSEAMEGDVVGGFCSGDMVQEVVKLGVVCTLGNVPLRFIGICRPNGFLFTHKCNHGA